MNKIERINRACLLVAMNVFTLCCLTFSMTLSVIQNNYGLVGIMFINIVLICMVLKQNLSRDIKKSLIDHCSLLVYVFTRLVLVSRTTPRV